MQEYINKFMGVNTNAKKNIKLVNNFFIHLNNGIMR
jgi:hypothetical protein